MKILILTFLLSGCLQNQFIYPQTMGSENVRSNKIPFFSLGIQAHYAPFLGDNFLSEHYEIRPGYILESRFGLKDICGLGFSLVKNQTKSYEAEFLGNFFNDIQFRDFGLFFYYQFFFNEKFGIEPQLGLGLLSVKHQHIDNRDKFKLHYQNVFAGLNGNFNLNTKRNLILIGGVRYGGYATDDITINKDDLGYIRKSTRILTQIGFRWEILDKR
ncbi:hypothetical protein M3O96_15010 [Aquiflexum sp. TKW24L]|uniref:hypothetical protein n=1 Tax=Aquiflexum sp. TKW24L TaxID=2942212 RepID=UPI0020BEF608|nr:hypothetical protein [Aquiflexum sp. TKW24L]MCL6260410.1 hypothetical protein [Aquiflexum sp. TKW24L]